MAHGVHAESNRFCLAALATNWYSIQAPNFTKFNRPTPLRLVIYLLPIFRMKIPPISEFNSTTKQQTKKKITTTPTRVGLYRCRWLRQRHTTRPGALERSLWSVNKNILLTLDLWPMTLNFKPIRSMVMTHRPTKCIQKPKFKDQSI